MEQFLLSIDVGYGNPGLHQNAKFFFGSTSGTGVGQWTDLRGETFHTRPSVHYVTKRKKTLNICSPHVCSLGIFGSEFLHLWAYKISSRLSWIVFLQIGGEKLWKRFRKIQEKVNSIIILGAWVIWKHRNLCFDGARRASTTSSGCSDKSNTSDVLLELEVWERWVKIRETRWGCLSLFHRSFWVMFISPAFL